MRTDFSLKRLKSFCAVAHYGGFGAAAEALGIAQSTLSTHIAELEAELRAKLVWRTTRRVRLTPSGKRFLVRAQHALDELQNAARELRDQAALQRGHVVLACMPTLASHVAPSAIAAFCDRHPGVFVDLIDQPARLVESAVLNAEADLGIGSQPEWVSSLAFEPLAVDRFVAVIRTDYHAGSIKSLQLKDLASNRLITLNPSPSIRRSVEQVFAEAGLTFEPRYQVARQTTALGLAEAGLGIALLPETAVPKPLTGRLRAVAVKPKVLRSFGIIQRRGEPLSPPAAELRNFLRRALRNLASGRRG